MKVLIVSTYDTGGGAARAAYRLCEALNKGGQDCQMLVAEKKGGSSSVRLQTRLRRKIVRRLAAPYLLPRLLNLQKPANRNTRSLAVIGTGAVDVINRSDADVVNLHWVHGEMFSVRDFMSIRKPVVWTLHDMWAFCGAEHYTADGLGARWRTGYTPVTRDSRDRGLDLDRWVWRRKQSLWKKQLHLVTPSRWLADCCRESALLDNWPVTSIPNPLDMDIFQPWPKDVARAAFKLPLDKKLILFGAHGNDISGRKGVDLLYNTMQLIAANGMDAHGIIFGQSVPENPPDVGIPLHWVGRLNDEVSLALLYSAADVMVVPSRMENLPQTGTEAQSCGCPVVAFKIGGLPDIVSHKSTGYLADPYDIEDLANGIIWVLDDFERTRRIAIAARTESLKKWDTPALLQSYLDVFQFAINNTI